MLSDDTSDVLAIEVLTGQHQDVSAPPIPRGCEDPRVPEGEDNLNVLAFERRPILKSVHLPPQAASNQPDRKRSQSRDHRDLNAPPQSEPPGSERQRLFVR